MEEMAQMGIKETLSKGLRGFGKARFTVSHGAIITYSALLLILFIAFTIRVLPIRWEIPSGTLRLNEFDPYYQFALTNRMVQYGLLSPYFPTPWVNTQQFYPAGLDMSTSLPSLPMTTAILYNVVSVLGAKIDLMSFASLMAPLLGTIAVLVLYFVGKDMGGKAVGLLSALILALSPSIIQRSSLGFFDTETVGVVALLLFIYMFLRAIDQNRSLRSMTLYSVGSALALAYFSAGWGAAYFLIGLAVLFVFVMVLIRRYSQRLLLSYSITFGLGLFIAIGVPFLSPRYLTTGVVLPVAGMFALLCVAEVFRAKISARTKTMFVAAFLVVLVGGFAFVWGFGDITSIAGKFASVLDPFARSSQPLIESVAEHRITAWGSIYYELGIGILFFLMGMYFTLKNPTNRNVFLVVFGLTTLYFASSMVRLLILLAPAFALLGSIGVLGMLKPFYTLLSDAGSQVTVKSKRGLRKVGKEYSVIAILTVFVLLVSAFAFSPQTGGQPRVYGAVYAPMAITAASLPIAPNQPIPQWLDMVSWTRTNLQATTVVSSWWDYGNWLGYLGNVTTLCDNTTVNGTQIENVGFSFMANETQALKMLANYNASYALVFVTLRIASTTDQQTGQQTVYVTWANFGDEGKYAWMARISGGARDRLLEHGYMDNQLTWTNETSFGNRTLGIDWNDLNNNGQLDQGETTPNLMGENSTIYKLMTWAKQEYANKYGIQSDQTGIQPKYFLDDKNGGSFTGLELDPNTAAKQYGTLVPIVALYKIDWQTYYADMNATAPAG